MVPVDASRGNFLGLTIQPDVVIVEQRSDQAKVIVEPVRGVIELKAATNKKQAAPSHVIQRAYEIIKGRGLFGKLVRGETKFSLIRAVVHGDRFR